MKHVMCFLDSISTHSSAHPTLSSFCDTSSHISYRHLTFVDTKYILYKYTSARRSLHICNSAFVTNPSAELLLHIYSRQIYSHFRLEVSCLSCIAARLYSVEPLRYRTGIEANEMKILNAPFRENASPWTPVFGTCSCLL